MQKTITIQQYKRHQKNCNVENNHNPATQTTSEKLQCRIKPQSSNTNNIRKNVNVENNHNPATQTTSEKL
jgi:hypothetical protein